MKWRISTTTHAISRMTFRALNGEKGKVIITYSRVSIPDVVEHENISWICGEIVEIVIRRLRPRLQAQMDNSNFRSENDQERTIMNHLGCNRQKKTTSFWVVENHKRMSVPPTFPAMVYTSSCCAPPIEDARGWILFLFRIISWLFWSELRKQDEWFSLLRFRYVACLDRCAGWRHVKSVTSILLS